MTGSTAASYWMGPAVRSGTQGTGGGKGA
jgi:hypothetical protein